MVTKLGVIIGHGHLMTPVDYSYYVEAVCLLTLRFSINNQTRVRPMVTKLDMDIGQGQ